MIRIRRPRTAPNALLTGGRRLRDEHVAQHAGGEIAFTFDRDVYGHADVKQALRTAQYDKCGFCESKVTHIAFGDVEHFRPKAAFRRDHGGAATSPGYFWLAYEWTNLLFACEQCNRRHKGSLFPLIDEATRARAPTDDLASEVPLFIDPTTEDPTLHIGFREEFPYAVGGSARGETTWRALGLDREALAERRRDHLEKIRSLRDASRLLARKRDRQSNALVQQIDAQLRAAVNDRAEYAAMVRFAMSSRIGTRSAPPTQAGRRGSVPPVRITVARRSGR